MSFKNLTLIASAPIATGGSIVFGYPAGTDAGMYVGAKGHKLFANNGEWVHPAFAITFGASDITVVNPGAPIAPGTLIRLQAEIVGPYTEQPLQDVDQSGYGPVPTFVSLVRVKFGAVSAIAANTVLNAAAVASTDLVPLTSPVTFDVPRAPSIVSSNAGDTTQSITLRGFDAYGAAITETRALNGTTTVNFQRAFKTIVSYQASVALAGNLSIGQTKILGLPFFVPDVVSVVQHIENSAIVGTAGVVAGSLLAATAATGDVRGTWSPPGTPDNSRTFELLVAFPDLNDRGNSQFAG